DLGHRVVGGLPGAGRGHLCRAVRGGDPRDPLTSPTTPHRPPVVLAPGLHPLTRSRHPFPGAGPTTGPPVPTSLPRRRARRPAAAVGDLSPGPTRTEPPDPPPAATGGPTRRTVIRERKRP